MVPVVLGDTRVHLVCANTHTNIPNPYRFAGLFKHVAHARGADAAVHLLKLGASDGEKGYPSLPRNGLGEQGLARAGGAHHEHTRGRAGTHLEKCCRLLQKRDNFHNLLLDLVDAGNVVKGHTDFRAIHTLELHAHKQVLDAVGRATQAVLCGGEENTTCVRVWLLVSPPAPHTTIPKRESNQHPREPNGKHGAKHSLKGVLQHRRLGGLYKHPVHHQMIIQAGIKGYPQAVLAAAPRCSVLGGDDHGTAVAGEFHLLHLMLRHEVPKLRIGEVFVLFHAPKRSELVRHFLGELVGDNVGVLYHRGRDFCCYWGVMVCWDWGAYHHSTSSLDSITIPVALKSPMTMDGVTGGGLL